MEYENRGEMCEKSSELYKNPSDLCENAGKLCEKSGKLCEKAGDLRSPLHYNGRVRRVRPLRSLFYQYINTGVPISIFS